MLMAKQSSQYLKMEQVISVLYCMAVVEDVLFFYLKW